MHFYPFCRSDDDDASFEKRNIVGFQGVRGKKFLLNYPPMRFIPKRAPSGFMGMRGKKFYDDQFTIKRAPSGFMGKLILKLILVTR
jgi:hypothetical protein